MHGAQILGTRGLRLIIILSGSFRIIDENAETAQQQKQPQQQPQQQQPTETPQPPPSASQQVFTGQSDKPPQPLAPEGNSHLFYRIKLKLWERYNTIFLLRNIGFCVMFSIPRQKTNMLEYFTRIIRHRAST
jgi:hypothetical protein